MQEKNLHVDPFGLSCLTPVCLVVVQVTESSLISLNYILKIEVAIEEVLKRVKTNKDKSTKHCFKTSN